MLQQYATRNFSDSSLELFSLNSSNSIYMKKYEKNKLLACACARLFSCTHLLLLLLL